MRRTIMTLAAGVLLLASAAQSATVVGALRQTQPELAEGTIMTKFNVPVCRIRKALKYDFNGNPYIQKSRICA